MQNPFGSMIRATECLFASYVMFIMCVFILFYFLFTSSHRCPPLPKPTVFSRRLPGMVILYPIQTFHMLLSFNSSLCHRLFAMLLYANAHALCIYGMYVARQLNCVLVARRGKAVEKHITTNILRKLDLYHFAGG